MLVTTALMTGCDWPTGESAGDPRPAPIAESHAFSPSDSITPPWVLDPTEPGPNLPPVGRSLFDFLIIKDVKGKKVYDIPFPFSSLLTRIESHLHTKDTQPALKQLLIPVNRSLQRRAGDGAYFAYPRAVLAVDTEAEPSLGPSSIHLKDRLFIGYHEKTGVLEIISYNEAAGRFEFQVVTDYRSGGTPTVRYANRALCTACHQNQSPIFSRPMWDETNVNPKIAALLAHQRRAYHGFPVRQGVGVLQAFDDATDRANDLALVQLLWRDGCELAGRPEQSIMCRAELIEWVLQYGLSKELETNWHTTMTRTGEVPSFLTVWRTRWPHGLSIPNPDIPNRNPFRYVAVDEFPGLSAVEATALEGREPRSLFRGPFEPTLPREPLEIWTVPDTPQALERVLATFVQFLSKADRIRLERLTHRQPNRLHQAVSVLVQDSVLGRTDTLAHQPFRRVSLLTALEKHLNAPAVTRCCLNDQGMPPPVDDVDEAHHSARPEQGHPPAGMLKTFHHYCGACHHGADGFPPNFLHGSTDEIQANLAQCADRIFVRLRMWDVPNPEQPEAPMPPAMHLSHHRIPLDQWKQHPDLLALRKETEAALQRKRGVAFKPEELLQQEYDSLPACLAPHRAQIESVGTHHG